MPRNFACDHCGRTGVTFGVYYPGKDMTQPAIRLCQTYQGNPITPNCYHLVVELGEQLGFRKKNAIVATDRQSPKVEAVNLRFTDAATGGGVIYSETVQPTHPLAGERILQDLPAAETDPAVTKAEEAKGIINPHGADQRPLIDPASEEGQRLADEAAKEQAAKITIPGGMGGNVGTPQGNGPKRYVPGGEEPEPAPVTGDYVDEDGTPMRELTEEEKALHSPGATHVVDNAADPAAKTPAQIAAEAQAKADEEEAARVSTKDQVSTTNVQVAEDQSGTVDDSADVSPAQPESDQVKYVDETAPATEAKPAAKKASGAAKKAAAKKATAAKSQDSATETPDPTPSALPDATQEEGK